MKTDKEIEEMFGLTREDIEELAGVLLSLNEIIMQGERRGNNSRQALPR